MINITLKCHMKKKKKKKIMKKISNFYPLFKMVFAFYFFIKPF